MNANQTSGTGNPKVFVMGVDGATLDMMLPLIETGELPNFGKIVQEGVWGELESTVPPSSGPAWTSFQTGKTPSSHGIFDFVTKKPKSYEMVYVNSTNIKGARLWDILGKNGLKSGVINVMVTYPPHPINGFILTGGLTPTGKNFAYPESLAHEITERFGEYRKWGVGGVTLTHGKEDKFIDNYFSNEKRRMEMTRYLMKEKEWDFFMVMIESTDPLQHELWKYIDESHPRFEPDAAERIKKAIPAMYQEVDKFLGEMIETLPTNTTICIMSDHGFGPMDRYLQVNNFLIEIGMLKLHTNTSGGIKRLAFNRVLSLERMYRMARRIGLSRAAKVFRGGSREKMLSRLVPSYQDIDWSKTKAFAMGASGHIYLNVKGREPQGIVNPGDEYHETRNYITDRLLKLTDPKSGANAVEKVFTKEELHKGQFSGHAPDISFLPGKGFGTLHRQQFVSPAVFIDSPSCGTHRINGITMFYGPDIADGKQIQGARIFDLAPTILHLCGLPIPNDMDGRVLKEVFKDNSDPAKRNIVSSRIGEGDKIKRRIGHLKKSAKL